MKTQEQEPEQLQKFSRRQFMIYRSTIADDTASMADVWTAIEAVASWAIEHPDVDMDEEMTWAEWEAQGS